jgi:hypothetical protein
MAGHVRYPPHPHKTVPAAGGCRSDRLGRMVLTRTFTAKNQPMTILIGQLNDQAALSGVMNALYGQHLPVLSVELLEESQH